MHARKELHVSDLYDDEWADEVAELDQEPIPGLGELPDCDDDEVACQVVGPADAGGAQ